MLYSELEKDNFLEAVDSLKKYRRAELIDESGNNLLSHLYTDLLANEQILKTCLKGNTTFIIGRKGTGKSTIFLKIQQELRKKDNNLSCYVDAKTIFESSKSEYVNGVEELKNFVSNDVLQNYLIERNFIQTILSELREEIAKKSSSLIDRIKELFGIDRSSIVREKLQILQNSIENNEHLKSIELPLLQQISKPINRESLEAASQKYFERNIEHFFDNTTYSMMSFDEKISILQLKELLQQFIDSLSNTRKKIIIGEITGNQYEDVKTNPYTSHFYFKPTYEHFLKTLELNFFISKYSERSDRNSEKQSIYCLNYGLCKKENLRWGKPKGSNYRTYFISKSFDFNSLIDDFLKNSKRLICINPKCKKSFPFEDLHYLEYNKMLCPECHNPVNIVSNSETIQLELEKIDKSKLLPPIELSILYEINKTEKPLKAKEIAEELDCSYQLIGKRAKKLNEEKELIFRIKVEGNKVVYKLTEKAKDDYFNT